MLYKSFQYTDSMVSVKVSKEAWTDAIEHPRIIADKAYAPLCIWGSMKPEAELLKTAKGEIHNVADNMDKLFAFQVDVDNGCTIDEFVERYKEYRFDLYTSYSYGFKEGDRFRIIFPMKEPLEMRWLGGRNRPYMRKFFPMADVSCFDRGHWQILPVVRSADAPYRFIRNEGKPLDAFPANEFDDRYTQDCLNNQMRKLDQIGKQRTRKFDGLVAWAQGQIDSAEPGNRDNTYIRVLWGLKEAGATYEDVCGLTTPYPDMEKILENKILKMFG